MEPDRTQVEAVMSSPVETVSRRASLREAARAMSDRGVSALLVTGPTAGIVTSTDVLEAVARGDDPEALTVEDVMTAPVETVTAKLALGEAAAMMTTYGIKHLPVVDRDGEFVGMVSSTDLTGVLV